jgi:peptide/nickel transport system substrate-binding protein
MSETRSDADLTRRGVLKLGGLALAGGLAGAGELGAPAPAVAQTPKRGGVFRFAGFDPPNFDPHQSVHWWTFIYTSLTHGGLMRHKAGPGVQPGTLPVEPHLAESWERPNDTTYVFKLRKGVRWHNKPR